ncbi:hypothetical protein OEZ86_001155 [Tetradesmus obliquus]|nr:hypothetical protein OEZ86_001155 [Tetradesmus obliquus]
MTVQELQQQLQGSSCKLQRSGSSIYDLHSKKRRYLYLCISALASTLVPLCDTIYLPALRSLQADFATSESMVNASIAVYMFAVALAVLFFGPCADKFGRRPVFIGSILAFIGASLACYFSPSIQFLIAFRGVQGAVAAAFSSTGAGMLADIIPPAHRGTAMGISNIPMFIGPILGPVLGGGLSQAFGWRSTFMAVIMYAAVILLPLLIFVVPETHQYIVLQRLKSNNALAAAEIDEAPEIERHPPRFQAPWYPYQLLLDRAILLHAASTFVAFGAMFCCVVQLSWFLAAAPYYISPAMIGIACLAQNAAGFFFCPIGGKLSDIGYAKNPQQPQLKLLYNNAANLVLLPASVLLYGWSFHFKLHIAIPLIALFLVGVATSIYVPAVFSYLTTIKQQNAAAACAGVQSLMFLACGLFLLVAGVAVEKMGAGPFFTLLAGLCVVSSTVAGVQIHANRKAAAAAGELAAAAQQREQADDDSSEEAVVAAGGTEHKYGNV